MKHARVQIKFPNPVDLFAEVRWLTPPTSMGAGADFLLISSF